MTEDDLSPEARELLAKLIDRELERRETKKQGDKNGQGNY